MHGRSCPIHHLPLEPVPQEPRSLCPNCRYMTHHLHFDDCPRCGHKLEIEYPEPEWRCPRCSPEPAAGSPRTAPTV